MIHCDVSAVVGAADLGAIHVRQRCGGSLYTHTHTQTHIIILLLLIIKITTESSAPFISAYAAAAAYIKTPSTLVHICF
jgi:hypothetical protein